LTKFIIDCDPGHDDAVAILFGAKYCDLIGITTVYGNSTVQNTTRNALAICELAGLKLPVAQGLADPLSGARISGEIAHGKTGLDGAELPSPQSKPISQSAVDFLIEQAEEHRGDLVIVAVAPITNVATALQTEPKLRSWLKAISIMGGSTHIGNVTASAEFNTYTDPEAAEIVFDSGVPIHMVGLNVTTQFGIAGNDIKRLRLEGGKLARELANALDFYLQRQGSLYGRTIAPIHDVCAWLPYTHPGLIDYQATRVSVETGGRHTRGMTVCDFRGLITGKTGSIAATQPANAEVAVDVRGDAIIELVLDTLLEYP
jgi:inosine-uridine nucleoside N-ribohydrolase|tara:strand:+ start:15882 stop:16829 length:948 start_codon:yes stop_codon:yes gene_type:complete